VAGLAQVQSTLASLSGTVNSLSSTVSGLGDAIDTAVAEGLADIQEDITAIEAAVADVASSDAVSDLQAAVDASQEDLEDLLANSSVFQGNVIINSVSTLDVYSQMGTSLNIVNGYVDIDAKADMDTAKLQGVVDNILTTVGEFSYEAESSAVGAVTFQNLTGTQTLTIKQGGDYRFDNLTSATNVILKDDYKSKVSIIHFGALTSVAKFYTSTASANLIDFSKATELHLTSLAYYPPNDLTIKVDEGATLAAPALDDVDSAGKQSNITLDIDGPASFTATNLTDGSLTFTNVKTVDVDGFEGSFTIGAGVESFSADKVTALTISGATDLETLDITGALDPDVSTDKAGPAITIEDNANIESVTLAGKVGAVILEGNANLTDVVISAEVDGKINIGDDAAAADGNTDLTNITLTGAKATAVEISNNSDLESLTIDLTFWAGTGTSAKLDGSVEVESNSSLTSLTVSSDKVENLTVIGNDDLNTLDFTGLAVAGATGSPEVYIYNNDLSGSMTDATDGDTNVANGKAGDLGSVSSDSGIATLKTYLTAVAADADSTVKVLLDTVDFTNEADSTNEYTYATSADAASEYLRIAYITPNDAAAGKPATKGKRSLIFDNVSGNKLQVWANGVQIFDTDGNGTPADLTFSGNDGLDVASILDSDNVARAAGAGVTLTAQAGANATLDVTILGETSSATAETSDAAPKAISLTTSDVITLTAGGITVTATAEARSGTSTRADAENVALQLIKIWEDKHTASSTLAKFNVAASSTLDSDTSASYGATFTFTAKNTGSAGNGLGVSISVASYDGTTTPVIPVRYGSTTATTDNTTVGSDLMITLESTTAGALGDDQVGLPATGADSDGTDYAGTAGTISYTSPTAGGTSTVSELYTNYRPYADIGDVTSTDNKFVEHRADVTYPEDAVAAGASTAANYSRIGWL
ncbi:hypothetical protein N9R82_06475, partial [Flavobacteriaceae bacterium]|nr:hypothetical protein [Flavobacteriaceae bacterium]